MRIIVKLCLLLSVIHLKAQTTFNSAFQIGGTGADIAKAIVTDSQGNVYVGGTFRNTVDFDPGAGTTTITAYNGDDGFVAKYSSTGALVNVYTFTNNLGCNVTALQIDASDNLYIGGNFDGVIDLDPSATGTTNVSTSAYDDVFILKLSSSGTFLWGKSLASYNSNNDVLNSIALDGSGNVYMAGKFAGSNVDFDPSALTYTLSSKGLYDGYVVKLDASGNFVFAFAIGSTSQDDAMSIVTGSSSQVYVVGQMSGTIDFDPSSGIQNVSLKGFSDAFIASYNSNGTYAWAESIGGASATLIANAITIDASNNIYIAGQFMGAADFDMGGGSFILNSIQTDGFIGKYSAMGAFMWANKLTSTGADNALTIKTQNNNLYVAGIYGASGFNLNPVGSYTVACAGQSDAFIAKFNTNGGFISGDAFGGLSSDILYSLSIDANNNIYTTGTFSMVADFDPTSSTFTLASNGNTDGFVHKMKDLSIGISEILENSKETFAFPNPTNESVFIKNNSYYSKLELYNTEGNLIFSLDNVPSLLDFKNLGKGAYFIKVYNENKSLKNIQKVIVN